MTMLEDKVTRIRKDTSTTKKAVELEHTTEYAESSQETRFLYQYTYTGKRHAHTYMYTHARPEYREQDHTTHHTATRRSNPRLSLYRALSPPQCLNLYGFQLSRCHVLSPTHRQEGMTGIPPSRFLSKTRNEKEPRPNREHNHHQHHRHCNKTARLIHV